MAYARLALYIPPPFRTAIPEVAAVEEEENVEVSICLMRAILLDPGSIANRQVRFPPRKREVQSEKSEEEIQAW